MNEKIDTMPSEKEFFIAYSNAKNDEDRAKIVEEYDEQTEAYFNNPNRINHILD